DPMLIFGRGRQDFREPSRATRNDNPSPSCTYTPLRSATPRVSGNASIASKMWRCVISVLGIIRAAMASCVLVRVQLLQFLDNLLQGIDVLRKRYVRKSDRRNGTDLR
ncbi:hypothetical protein ACV334_32970, partial [Pseudomonas aeruginosa]